MPSARSLGLTTIFVLACALSAFAQAARIDTISPTMARPGDQVTITGIGFGGPNVRISVGGRPARVVSGYGDRATFIVPDGVFAGRTTVAAINPGGPAGTIPFHVLLTYTLDEAQAVHGSFGPNGGVLRTQSGGMTFTLTIPPFALDHEETITLTPVITMADLPLSHGLIAAARFSPEGLRFRFPARLTIDVPAGLPPGVVLGFNAPDDGTGFHPIPSQTTGTSLEFLVFHFTLVGGGVPVPADIAQQLASVTGSPADVALSQIALLIAEEGQGTIDHATAEAAEEAAMRTWFNTAVKPGMTAASTDDERFFNSGAVEELLAWDYVDELYFGQALGGCSGDLEPECSAGLNLLVAGATNAISKSNQRCLADHAVSPYVFRVLSIWYMNETGLFPPDAPFDLETITGNLCVRPRITGIDLPAQVPPGSPTTVIVHGGAFFTDGTPVAAPDNNIELHVNASGGQMSPGSATIAGPGDLPTALTPDSDVVSVTASAYAQWLGVFIADSVDTTACVDPATLQAGGCHWPITITPANPTVATSKTQTFTATVNGVARPMSWSASGVAGSIVSTGTNTATFTAGTTLGTFTITARSSKISTESATTNVTVGQGPITITVTPQNATVNPGQSLAYSATVSGGATNAVTWSATSGSIQSTGPTSATFTAGPTGGIFGVTATSADDLSQSQTVAVTVNGSSPAIFSFNFDDGLQGWNPSCVLTAVCHPNGAATFGMVNVIQLGDNPGKVVLLDGTLLAGTWISKSFDLPANVTTLEFDVGGHNRDGADARFVVRIVDANGSTTLLDQVVTGTPTATERVLNPRSLSIAGWAGRRVTIFFEQHDNGAVNPDTGQLELPGRHEQIYLDNVRIR